MTIKQLGGVFGRNPTFNDVTIEGELTFDGDIDINSDLKISGDLEVGNNVLYVDESTGNVGINTDSPNLHGWTKALTVNTDNNTAIELSRNGTKKAAIALQGDDRIQITSFEADPVQLRTANTDRLVVSGTGNGDVTVSTGNLVIGTSGRGIDFSATSDGSGTSTSELFDDYEEGTWTPTIGGVSVGSGNYTKVGALIFIECLITANSVSTTTINGLPYNLVSAQGYGGVSFGRLYNASVLDANGVPCRVRLSGGDINFRNNAVNATDSNFTITTPASGTVRLGINGVARVS